MKVTSQAMISQVILLTWRSACCPWLWLSGSCAAFCYSIGGNRPMRRSFDIIQAVLLSATVASLRHALENHCPFFDTLRLTGFTSGALALISEFLFHANANVAGMNI